MLGVADLDLVVVLERLKVILLVWLGVTDTLGVSVVEDVAEDVGVCEGVEEAEGEADSDVVGDLDGERLLENERLGLREAEVVVDTLEDKDSDRVLLMLRDPVRLLLTLFVLLGVTDMLGVNVDEDVAEDVGV